MSRIGSKNTKPELAVRSVLHRLGYRFRLNGRVSKRLYPAGVLPGKPDIVLAKYHMVVFVHGCFWHRHAGCKYASVPKSRVEYWKEKFEGNVKRDIEKTMLLEALGWKVVVIWECEVKDSHYNLKKISDNFI